MKNLKSKVATTLVALGILAGGSIVTAAPAQAASYRYCHNDYKTSYLSGPYTVQYCSINYTVAERWNYGSARPYGWNWYSRVTWTSRWGYAVNPTFTLSNGGYHSHLPYPYGG